jgi:DNA-binding transcriptional MerR regulator
MSLIYKAKDVMDKLDLKESVFKKYIGLLEREGYVVQKNQQGHRLFTDDDIKILESFIELSKYDGMTLESVAKQIGSVKKNEGHDAMIDKSYDVMTLVETAVSNALQKQEERFRQVLKQQDEFNKQLLERIDQQHSYIEGKLKERDQLLIESLREVQETKKQMIEVTAAKEIEEKVRKKGFWSRLFGK